MLISLQCKQKHGMLNSYPPPPVYHLACTMFMQAMDYLVWAALPGRRQQLIVGFGCFTQSPAT
jgi:hypothetical protein